MVRKKRAAIRRRAKRKQAKAEAERHFLSRKISKRTNTILKECPDIGKEIESYVQSCNVGADAWRRTGVLTFDGNRHVKEKATYKGYCGDCEKLSLPPDVDTYICTLCQQ